MRYFDTSFLVPLVLPEPLSAHIARFVGALAPGEPATSHWARVEFSSVLAREVRMGALDAAAFRAADSKIATILNDTFELWLPNAEDFELARNFVGSHETGLRGGDALHLAIARNRRIDSFYTLDRRLIRAGEMLGVPMNADFALPRD